MKGTAGPIAVLVLLTAALRLPLLDVPFERDEGEYAYVAWRLDHDELPYRDWIDQKPPAIFWVYRLAMALPLDPVRAVHFMGLLFSAAAAVVLYFLARRFMGRPWDLIAASLLAVLSADPFAQGTAANTELFMLLPLVGAQLAFLAAARGGRGAVAFSILTGVLTGVATAFKQVALVNWLFLVVAFPFVASGETRWRRTASFLCASTTGIAAVWGAIVGYFAMHGAVGDVIHDVFTHNLGYVSALSYSARWDMLAGTLTTLARSQAVLWLLGGVGLASVVVSRKTRPLSYLLSWGIASLVGVSASGYFFPHYFQQAFPALAVCAALGAEALWRAGFWSGLPAWSRSAALAVALTLPAALVTYPFYFRYGPEEAVRVIYPGNHFDEMPALARRVAMITRPEDRVFVFGAEPEILFHARRASATRYIILFPLYGPYPDARERQIATAREIELARPAAAVVLPNALFSLPGSEQYFTRWSREYLEANFRADTFLTLDPSGVAHVVSGADGEVPRLPAGQRVLGAVMTRKSRDEAD